MEAGRDLALVLKGRGLRVTHQRVAVLDFLVASPDHPTAEEIGAAVNRKDPTASRASVYNVLRSLTRAGLVSELVLDDAVARYDANLERHHHFVCTACRKVEDVPEPCCATALAERFPDGRVVNEVSVTLRGLCPACAKGGAKN